MVSACGGDGSSAPASTNDTVNTAPVADAGPDQAVTAGNLVNLDGSGSFDADGDTLAFTWTFTSTPTGSVAILSGANTAEPSFAADIPGEYLISLVASDGQASSLADSVAITASAPNPIPVADAGANQSVVIGTLVTLDGSGSFDSNGDSLTYLWSWISIPQGSAPTLSNPISVKPSFAPDVAGEYVVSLVVNDGTSDSPVATVVVTASLANAPPVANAGSDQNVVAGSIVTLDGSASSDSDGDPITFSWTLVSVPTGSSAVLSDLSSAKPTFTADVQGEYVVSLTVSDGMANSEADSVLIAATKSNANPIADAGAQQNVLIGTLVTLDGSSSFDADGDSLTFAWTFTSVPEGSAASLVDANTPTAKFTADVEGIYVVSLIVNDGQASSEPDSVTITATKGNSVPVADAGADQNIVTGVPATLDGTGSFDADGDPLTYLWTVVSAPAGSTLSGQTATGAVISFVADIDGAYVISLVVNDGQASSAASTVTVTATTINAAPIANAGPDQTVIESTVVFLDGTGSSDANSDPLTYSWSLISQPPGSGSILLSNPTSATPSFVPPLAGSYVVSLVVNDGTVDSEADTVVITAISVSPPFIAHFLYGGTGYSVFLGCLNCNSFDADSVCNRFGNYGSAFATNSIWNQFGTYGSQFSTYSPWNSFSFSGPEIIGSDGLFYGYFTTNTFRANRTLIPAYVNVLNYYSSTGDLAATRVFACGG
jgi:hypothetical protein